MARIKNVKGKSIITTGFPEVDNLLATLPVKLQKKAIKKGTRAGAKIVLQRAKILVPHEDGVLESTLKVRTAGARTGRKLKPGDFGHTVIHVEKGAGDEVGKGGEGDPFYSRWVEYGTKFHPGDPYIRPALYDSRRDVNAAVRKAIIEGVDEIARKAKK